MGPRLARTRSPKAVQHEDQVAVLVELADGTFVVVVTEPASDLAVELCESSDDGERKDVPCHACVHNKFQERVLRLPNTDKHGAKVLCERCIVERFS